MSTPTTVEPLPYAPDELSQRLGSHWADRLRSGYRWMLLARALDQRMAALQRQGRIGFYGPATGQEAVSVGAGLVSGPQDWIVPGLREQLVALVRGHPLGTYMNHLFANDEDPARGRQMPCHPTARDVNYVSMSSVVGTQISHGVGLAYAMKFRNMDAAVLTFFGDGATSANDFHAGLNFAAVLQLPVVFCCTNNQWAISLPVERQTRVAHLADKARAYGLKGQTVDGTDLVAVMTSLTQALDSARAGSGPSLLEFVTYRMTAHSTSDDPSRYQDAGWAERARARDPLHRLERWLFDEHLITESDRTKLMEEVENEVRDAVDRAEKVAPPDPSSMMTDVWSTPGSTGAPN